MLKDIINKEKARTAILMCSYNDYGKEADHRTLIQAENEREKGHKFINHLILRDLLQDIDRVKFNFLLDDIPIMAYGMMNLFKSNIEQVVVVGNRDTEQIFDEFVKTYNPNKDYERFKFAYEGEELSLSNTLRKGKERLNLQENELTLLLPGDIPFCFNLNPVIKDPDIQYYDGILDLNTKEKVGKYFPRNYHLRVKEQGKKYHIKEPNIYLFNLNKLDLDLLDIFFGGRKTYSEFKDDSAGKEKGRAYLIKERFIKNKRWKMTAKALGKTSFFMSYRLIPKINEKIIKKAKNTKYYNTLKYLLSPISKGISYLTNQPPVLTLSNLEKLAKIGIEMDLRIKVSNTDPATLEDIDSLEDWSYLNSMILDLKDHPSGPKIIYPHYKELQQFKEQSMPTLKKEIEPYKNYPEYMNSLFKQFGLSPNKNHPYYKDGKSFVTAPPYNQGKLDLKFSRKFVKNMIGNNILYHIMYVRTIKRN